MTPANLHTDSGFRLYFRNWITLAGTHAVELREEFGGRDGRKYSVRRKRWYYRNIGAAMDRIGELLDRGVPLRVGWSATRDIHAAASYRSTQ